MVNLGGWIGRAFSLVGGLIDHYVVDGAVNAVADVIGELAGGLRLIQTGRAQNYLLLALLGAAIFALLFVARSLT